MTIPERIQQLDDFKAVRFYEHISNILFSAIDVDAGTLMQHMPPKLAETPEMQHITQADEDTFDKPIESKEAVAFARQSLVVLASFPSTAQLVSDELNTWKDDSMIAGTILAVGGAISLIMLLATSEITYDKQNGLKIGIGSVKDKDQVDGRIKLVETLFKVITNFITFSGKAN